MASKDQASKKSAGDSLARQFITHRRRRAFGSLRLWRPWGLRNLSLYRQTQKRNTEKGWRLSIRPALYG